MMLKLRVTKDDDGKYIDMEMDPRKSVGDTFDSLNRYWELDGQYHLIFKSTVLDEETIWSETGAMSGDEVVLSKKACHKSLPEDIWRKRIFNEIAKVEDTGYKVELKEKAQGFDVTIHLTEKTASNSTILKLRVNRNYPFDKPDIGRDENQVHDTKSQGEPILDYLNRWNFASNIHGLITCAIDMNNDSKT